MREAWGSVIRASSFLRKDLVETVRQPRLFAALVLAPFLVLLLFGIGLKDHDPLVATVFVVPEGGALASELERFAAEPSWRLRVRGITQDEQEALGRLERGEVDLVVVFPEHPGRTVREGRRATVALYHNLVDPIESRALGLATRAAIDRLNRQIIRGWLTEGQERAAAADDRLDAAQDRVTTLQRAVEAGDRAAALTQLALLQADVVAVSLQLPPTVGALDGTDLAGQDVPDEQLASALDRLSRGLDAVSGETGATREDVGRIATDLDRLQQALTEFQLLSPETVLNPFQGHLHRLATVPISLSDFFAPAVVVLLLQHMLVTLVGLSVVRDEQLGTNELFRVAPLRTGEVMVGKYLAFLLLGAGVAALLVALLVVGLGVPLVGPLPVLAASVGALLFTGIGMGFLVALLARTDSQAVQYAMMVLLASIFLTGFLIGLDRVIPSLQVVAWLLPPTYGIALLRNVMLRGMGFQPLLLLGLVGIGTVLLGVSWALLRRRLGPARTRRGRGDPQDGGDGGDETAATPEVVTSRG